MKLKYFMLRKGKRISPWWLKMHFWGVGGICFSWSLQVGLSRGSSKQPAFLCGRHGRQGMHCWDPHPPSSHSCLTRLLTWELVVTSLHLPWKPYVWLIANECFKMLYLMQCFLFSIWPPKIQTDFQVVFSRTSLTLKAVTTELGFYAHVRVLMWENLGMEPYPGHLLPLLVLRLCPLIAYCHKMLQHRF